MLNQETIDLLLAFKHADRQGHFAALDLNLVTGQLVITTHVDLATGVKGQLPTPQLQEGSWQRVIRTSICC